MIILCSNPKKKTIVVKGSKKTTVKFIDLFARMGGIRLDFDQVFNRLGYKTECVLTFEIKHYAIQALKENFKQDNLVGDIC